MKLIDILKKHPELDIEDAEKISSGALILNDMLEENLIEDVDEFEELPDMPDFRVKTKEEVIAETTALPVAGLFELFGASLFTTYQYLLDGRALYEIVEFLTPTAVEFEELEGLLTKNNVGAIYIKNRFLKVFKELTTATQNKLNAPAGAYRYAMRPDDLNAPAFSSARWHSAYRIQTEELLQGLFMRNAIIFFESNVSDFLTSEYDQYLDFINEKNLEYLEILGYSKEILRDYFYDSDTNIKYPQLLLQALKQAIADGHQYGAAEAAKKDFEYAFKQALPAGTNYVEKESKPKQRFIDIYEEFILHNYLEIMKSFPPYNVTSGVIGLEIAVLESFLNLFNEEFYFVIPENNWDNFSASVFNSSLYEELVNLENLINQEEDKKFKQDNPVRLLDIDDIETLPRRRK